LPDGTECDDLDGCTDGSTCLGGQCQGGAPVVCAALDDCHDVGTCNRTTGACSNPAKDDGATCDDGNACTAKDVCEAGTCQGRGDVVCDPTDDCHDPGICNKNTGKCSSPEKADGAACDDGNGCTGADGCVAGACKPGAPVVCQPLDDCHDPGICNARTGVCSNSPKPDGSSCDDGNPCTTSDGCHAGSCVGGTAVTCAPRDTCHDAGVCNPTTGACTNPPKADGTACSDGSACTRTDACQSGTCTGSNPVVCAATDQCHLPPSCDPATGACAGNPLKPDGAVCSDANACTRTDKCAAGVCKGANPVACIAFDQCHTAGTCAPATGVCTNPAKADGVTCNDLNACTKTDACQSGTCTGGGAVVCAAVDQCHVAGACSPLTGSCSNPSKANGTACNDGNACTTAEACQSGVCAGGKPVACVAIDECHKAGTCSPLDGCSNAPLSNGAPCTDPRACAGGGPSTCSNGLCAGGGCFADPADQCTLSAIDVSTGTLVSVPKRCPPFYVDPDTGAVNHCLALDTMVGALADTTCDASQTSCARTGCESSTGVCQYQAERCAAAACHTYSCDPSSGACEPNPDGNTDPCACTSATCTSTSCVDVYCNPASPAAENCDAVSPVDCDQLRPDTCHVVSAAPAGGCDDATSHGCVFDAVTCPSPPNGCAEYLQNPLPPSSGSPCCELADRCARLTATDPTNTYACVGGACAATPR
jgi:hypothetical protein